ncbi:MULTISPECIES: D-alanyl-D-alanine carboxypeptidase family protein [unclassified Candidatus Frackibacter]|uniref:D-alanyl-D-alanine carboxypeptidase family protein n=1 Tax=unclassified Candidatus Frackibacter TaxID=2648818 RepID=UPI000880038B|nr:MULTISPECIES: D-alanyl-D-alanine carboxypeptidase family protein [unclassified Candidatus Frackibacter]SDC01254.1 D-alanyl-D-alanine carboxypeptidase (penicillin-binding protein 5/6) [Candidatus Frackibacter sp. WG11]SEM32524.1 D-alanyl-D-alanine carboxypeptidase (penicillin-binding protein 5/6) [Candidatus Frackibacter sp. WG12]SFL37477.1 D-alanyl-D-alanine carboxypeptidase (penicillin-binding protein 5/6) [Candidatus Frackibacter sp. WG13]
MSCFKSNKVTFSRKHSLIALLIMLVILINTNGIAIAKPSVTARAAILIDAETGEILYAKNPHVKRSPASTTKIMTAILAIENGNLDDKVKVSRRAAYEGGSSIWLAEGEVLTLEELLYGLLLNSGNDAAVAIAEHIGGSVEEFAQMMNRKAREIGALDTSFQNPNGLPQKGHLTTAYDLAMIARYALQNKTFAKIVDTTRKTISWGSHEYGRSLLNTNRLLRRFDEVDGVKTGYTDAAGRCLVSSMTREGRQVISVVLKSGQMWHDSIKLLNYGFDNFNRIQLAAKDEVIYSARLEALENQRLEMVASQEFATVASEGKEIKVRKEIIIKDNLKLPIAKKEQIGKVTFYVDDELKGTIPLLAKEKLTTKNKFNKLWQWLTNQGPSLTYLK